MKQSENIIYAHKGFFDKECRKLFKENSKEVCSISGAKDHINIVELDVRKSKDGVLYCYHGTLLEYYFYLKFPKDLSTVKRKYGVSSLTEVLQVIKSDKIIFLDIKDSNISKEDILKVFENRKFKEIMLGNKSTLYLSRFNEMPLEFVKIITGNIFCNFYDLEKLRKNNFKYFEVVFPFQVRKKIIENVREAGMEFRCMGLFFSNIKSYWKKVNKYGIKHVSSDFI